MEIEIIQFKMTFDRSPNFGREYIPYYLEVNGSPSRGNVIFTRTGRPTIMNVAISGYAIETGELFNGEVQVHRNRLVVEEP